MLDEKNVRGDKVIHASQHITTHYPSDNLDTPGYIRILVV